MFTSPPKIFRPEAGSRRGSLRFPGRGWAVGPWGRQVLPAFQFIISEMAKLEALKLGPADGKNGGFMVIEKKGLN